MSAAECVTCGDPQSQHKGGKGGCRRCEFGCAEYVPETTAQPVDEPVTAAELATLETVTDVAIQRIAEVERERDQLAETIDHDRDRARAELAEERWLHAVTRTDLGVANAELAEANGRIRELALEVEQLGALNAEEQELRTGLELRVVELTAEVNKRRSISAGLVAEVDKQAGAVKLSALLARALEVGTPALTDIAEKIRGLVDQLERGLVNHERTEQLRAQERELLDQLAEVQRELGKTTLPPAPVREQVPDKVVREWAIKAGRDVASQGRVPQSLRDAYLAAMSA